MKKLLSTILAGTMLFSMLPISSVSASYDTPVELTMEATTFDVTLPTSLPITVSGDGTVVTATDVKIINNSACPVIVSDFSLTEDAWKLIPFDTEPGVGKQELGLTINGMSSILGGGRIGPVSPVTLGVKGELPVTYNAKTSFMSTASVINTAKFTITCGFNKTPTLKVGDKVTVDEYEYSYGQKHFNGNWVDSGLPGYGVWLSDKTKAPAKASLTSINGIPIVSLSELFKDNTATSLDLSGFDTSSVTDMGNMFHSCKATSLNLSSFDTSKVTIMRNMFAYSSATTLDLSSFDTSKVTDMRDMFGYSKTTIGYAHNQAEANKFNSSLNKPAGLIFTVGKTPEVGYKLTVDEYEYSYGQEMSSDIWVNSKLLGYGVRLLDNTKAPTKAPLTSINGTPIVSFSYLFQNSTFTTALDLSGWDTSKVTNMGAMFHSCKATSLNLSSFDTSKVTGMVNMFGSSSATSLDLSSFDTSNVTSMFAMFNDSKATNIKGLSSFDTSNVTSMSSMFSGTKATSLDLSSFDTSKVTSMVNMFYRSSATSLDLSSFDTSNVTNMNDMFNSSKATTLDLSSFDTAKTTTMSLMFSSCLATKAYARNQAEANKFNATTDKPTGLTFVVKPPAVGYKLTVGEYEYSYGQNYGGANWTNSGLTGYGVRLLDRTKAPVKAPLTNVNSTPIVSFNSLFKNGSAPTLNLSGWDTSNVTDMSTMFAFCSSTSINLSGWDTSNVTDMRSMFVQATATSVNLSTFDTSKVTNMRGMFSQNYATSLDLSGFDTSSVTDMGSMFSGAEATSVKGLSSFNTSKVTIMSNMFNSYKVTLLDLSSFNTSNVTDMGNMFRYCESTKGYARTQSDANKFNASENKSYGLTFVVKP